MHLAAVFFVPLIAVLASDVPRHQPFNWRTSHREEGHDAGAHAARSAALLRTKAHTRVRSDIDLTLAGDRLQGILDDVNSRFADVRTALEGINSKCEEEIANSVERNKATNDGIEDLDTVQAQQAGIQGKMQADLDLLSRNEEEAKSSYDSTVALRAKGRQAFLDRNSTLTNQEAVVAQVLNSMKEQEAVEGSADSAAAASLLSLSIEKTRASGPSGGFAMIIGIFTNMQDTLKNSLHKDNVEHTKKDKEYLALVASHKKMLQNVDAEYETKNAKKMEAQVTARDASFEKGLRSDLAKTDARASSALRQMCGNEHAKVPAALSAGERLLKRLQGQVTRALASIDELPSLAGPSAALTQLRHRRSKPSKQTAAHPVAAASTSPAARVPTHRRPKLETSNHVAQNSSVKNTAQTAPVPLLSAKQSFAIPEQAHDRSNVSLAKVQLGKNNASASAVSSSNRTRAVVDAMAHGSSASTGESVREGNSKKAAMWALLKASQSTHDDALRTMAQALPRQSISQDVAALALYSKKLEASSGMKREALKQSGDGDLSGNLKDCVDDKRRLTGEIVAARQAARQSRTQAASANARINAISGWLSLVDDQTKTFEEAEDSHISVSGSLADAGSNLESDLADAISEMSGIDAELDTYRGTDGAPPKAAALEMQFKGIRTSLISLKEKTPVDVSALTIESGNLKITYIALLNTLAEEETKLNEDKTAQDASLSSAEADVNTHESTEGDLMSQRSTVEQDCEAHMAAGSADTVNLLERSHEIKSAALAVATRLLSAL